MALSHWGRVTHICVSNLTIIGSDSGLSPSRRQAIIWTNAAILLLHLEMSVKRQPCCLRLNVLNGDIARHGSTLAMVMQRPKRKRFVMASQALSGISLLQVELVAWSVLCHLITVSFIFSLIYTCTLYHALRLLLLAWFTWYLTLTSNHTIVYITKPMEVSAWFRWM